MFVDVVYPGWVPFHRLGYVTDVFGFMKAHDQILEYEFETFVGGHLTRLETRKDVKTQREYINDLKDAAKRAIETVELDPIVKRAGTDNRMHSFRPLMNYSSKRLLILFGKNGLAISVASTYSSKVTTQ